MLQAMLQDTEKPNRWEFVPALRLIQDFALTRDLLSKMRQNLPEGVYWRRPSERKIFYNLRLLADYLMRGGSVESPEHQQLVRMYQEFMKQLISTPQP